MVLKLSLGRPKPDFRWGVFVSLKVAQKRLGDVAKYELHKFKESFLAYSFDEKAKKHKVEKFRLKIDDVLKEQKQIEENAKIADAVAKAKAEAAADGEGGLMRRFFS